MGVAETVPGVSGGTVALVTGIYSRLIASAKNLTDVPRLLLTRGDWRAAARRVDWWLLLPVAAGMAIAVFSIAGVMETFVTEQPVYSKALFMSMIATSIAVPFLEIRPGSLDTRRTKLNAATLFVVMAIAVFVLTSLPRTAIDDPPLVLVFCAAAIAVCALVLPGVSGSFFLLVVGIYAPTMAAVDDRNLSYLAVFGLGALLGLVTFVRVLEWILERHHTAAMIAAAGLLLGSLRALWPWQTPEGQALGIGDDWPAALGLFALGAVLVGIVAFAQHRLYASDAAIDDRSS
jgi:putative membrane protein